MSKIISTECKTFYNRLYCECGEELSESKILLTEPTKFEYTCKKCGHIEVTTEKYPALAVAEIKK